MQDILPTTILDREKELPEGSGNNFWLKDKVWEIPSFENSAPFVEHLVQAGVVT